MENELTELTELFGDHYGKVIRNYNNHIIEYYTKQVYGNEFMYIKDSGRSAIIQKLTGSKTINSTHKKALEELGFSLVEVLHG